MKWLFIDEVSETDVIMSGASFQHIKALRIKLGEVLRLFDGQGRYANAKVKQFDRRQAILSVTSIEQVQPVSKPRLYLGVTKFPALEVVLQKATEVGVKEIILLSSEYTPIRFNQSVFDEKRDRWQKIMQSACEQSKQLFVPKLSYQSYQAAIASAEYPCMLHPVADKVLGVSDLDLNTDVFIGPEGGWSDSEVSSFTGSIFKIEGTILRADTASIAALIACKLS